MKVAIYCRLSEEDRNKQQLTDDSESIQNQKSMLVQYACEQDWEIYGIYSDDDYAGADRKRPEFNKLLEDAKKRQFDIVLCKTQSRFTRELELVERYIHGMFPLWGIRFISIVDNADTANKGNKKSRQINGLVNEWYLEDMSENIKSVLTNRRQNGFHIGSFALYGYRKDPECKGHLIIDEEAAAVVREVFGLFAQGYGKTAIARILNDRGIPNPTEYKRLHGLRYIQPRAKNSTLWKYFAISDMLSNEIYIGNMVQGKYGSASYKTKQNVPLPKEQWYRVEGTHEPIIDIGLWERVQTLLRQRTKPFAVGTVGVFSGIAKCAGCGYALRSCKTRGRYYLKCPNRHVSKNACIGSFISAEQLEQAVVAELRRLTKEYLDTDKFVRCVQATDDLSEQRARLCAEITGYEKKIGEYAKGIKELYLDKVKGIIRENDFIEMSKDFNSERERLERIMAAGRNRLVEVEAQISACVTCESGESDTLGASDSGRRRFIDQYMYPEHLNREIVANLIDHISVRKRVAGSDDLPIEIHWSF